jgi:hypothetical protein
MSDLLVLPDDLAGTYKMSYEVTVGYALYRILACATPNETPVLKATVIICYDPGNASKNTAR